MTGVPAGATVLRAYLVWGFTGNTNYASLALATFNGSQLQGTEVGVGGGVCRGRTNTFAFMAPATELVQGNGTYSVALMDSAYGLSEGASLVVVYSSTQLTKHHLVISLGDDVVHNQLEQMDETFIFDPASGGDARTTYIGGDGQAFTETGTITGSAGSADISNNIDGSDGDSWDTDTYDISGLVEPGSSSISVNVTEGNDCLMWAGQVTSVATSGLPGIPLAQTFGPPCSCAGTATGYQHLTPLPVNTATGALTESVTDAAVNAPGIPFAFTRSYTSLDTTPGPMGPGWTFNYAPSVTVDVTSGSLTLRTDRGSRYVYAPGTNGTFLSPPGARSKVASSAGGYRLTQPNRTTMDFDSTGRLVSKKDRSGQGLTFGYTGSQLTAITDAANRTATLSYSNGLLIRVTLADQRHVDYGYTAGYLTTVTDMRGKTTTYEYDAGNRLKSARDPNGHFIFRNTYDGTTGRVTMQLDARGNETDFAWDPATQTATTIDPRGGHWTDVYDENVLLSRIDPLGHTTNYGYDQQLNPTTITDARGNATTMTYDTDGKILTRTSPAPLSYQESWTYNLAGDVLTYTDRRGKTTTNTYNTAGLLETVTDPLNHVTRFTYNSRGLVTNVTSPQGRETDYGYDTDGNLNIVRLGGSETRMTYDTAGRLRTVIDPRGQELGADPTKFTTTYAYDDANHVTTVTDARGNITTNTYDDAGLLATQKDAANNTTTFSYDAANNLHTVIDARGDTTTYEHDPDGRLTDITTPEGAHTHYGYDLAGHLTTRVDPRGYAPGASGADFTWTFTPDENGNRIVTSHPDPAGGPLITTITAYDVLNRSIDVTDALGHTTHTDYDGNNNITKVTDALAHASTYVYDDANHLKTSTDARSKATAYLYDADGNRIWVTTPLGETTIYGYDEANRLISMFDPRGHVPGANSGDYWWKFTYDRAGNPTTTTNPLGQVISTAEWDATNNKVKETDGTGDITSWTYDPLNRVNSVTGPDNAKTTYTYDSNGNLATRTDPNLHTTSYTYDKDNRLITTTTPLNRVWTNTYNAAGELIKTITPMGAATPIDLDGTVWHYYDSLGRQTRKDVSGGQGNTVLTYDAAGRIVTMVDEAGTETYAYTDDNQIASVTRTGTGPLTSPAAYAYSYDPAGNITHRNLPNGVGIDVAYDDDNRPTTLTRSVAGNTTPPVSLTYTYDAAGNPTTLKFPNGDTETRTFDPAGRVTRVRTTNGPNNATTGPGVSLIGQHELVLNADGQPTSLTTTQGTGSPTATSYAYTANRLTHFTTPDGWTTDLTYDGVGNRTSERRSQNIPWSLAIYTYDNDDEQTGQTLNRSLTYDANGNQTNSGDGNTYTYDAAGLIRSLSQNGHTTTYSYAGDGRRLTATTDGTTTRYAWDINNPLPMLTTEAREGITWDHLATPDGRTLRTDVTAGGAPSTTWLHADLLGSITETTTATGAIAHTYTYDPFGNPLTDIALRNGNSRFRYAGEYRDDSGTYNLRARQYQPNPGRFTQTEPIPAAVEDPYVSAYVYVDNQPTAAIDPSGLCKVTTWIRSLVPSHLGECAAEDSASSGGVTVGGAWADTFADNQDEMLEGGINGASESMTFGLAPDAPITDSAFYEAFSQIGTVWGIALTTCADLGAFVGNVGSAKRGDELLRALAASGVKHTPADIVRIARDASGRVVFLEKGNSSAGLTHILERHASDFARAGIPKSEIADLVIAAASRGTVVGMQRSRPIYEVTFRGRLTRVAVTVGNNGFIVGANPVG